ncbi:MAG: flagellar hook-basal body complex protein, partial [Defluviitaleaceae bacterium]|nr:flagellar hook-basal body complex protein [Defluviitaleaceae bacterium]
QFGPNRQFIDAESTVIINVDGNLDHTRYNPLNPPSMMISIHDSLGTRWVVDATFTRNATGGWDVNLGAYVPGVGGATGTWQAIKFPENDRSGVTAANPEGDRGVTFPIAGAPHTLAFGTNGRLTVIPNTFDIDIPNVPAAGPPGSPPSTFGTPNAGGTAGTVTLSFGDMTQFPSLQSNPAANLPLIGGGRRAGVLDGISVGPDGVVRGRYSNGQILDLAQIPVAIFRNPAGLEAVGNNLFRETANSGPFDGRGQDVALGGGQMLGGALEMSNVDLAGEFTDMIITQRGFQSNSRIISVSDEMLQILNNL